MQQAIGFVTMFVEVERPEFFKAGEATVGSHRSAPLTDNLFSRGSVNNRGSPLSTIILN